MKESFKVNGTITDSKGRSINFTEKDILILEIETGTTKRIVNNRHALKLQELVKERLNDMRFSKGNLYQLLQSLIEESEK